MRATYQTLRVLHTFGDGKSALCGSEIARVTKIGPGTLYPLLARLERGGIFKASWEKVEPSEVGRPRRRLYKITPAGIRWRNQIATSLGHTDRA